MNKSELVDAVADKVGDRRIALTAVESLLDIVTRTVSAGEKVALSGFGVFEKVDRAARTARNPATGAPVDLQATSVPRFRAGQVFKSVVSGARELPQADPPVARPRSRQPGRTPSAAAEPAAAAADAPADAPVASAVSGTTEGDGAPGRTAPKPESGKASRTTAGKAAGKVAGKAEGKVAAKSAEKAEGKASKVAGKAEAKTAGKAERKKKDAKKSGKK